MLQLESVTAWYGKTQVLFGVDLTVPEGETVALIGTNGAGKTTTLRSIAGLVDTGGKIRIDDHDVSAVPTHRRVRENRIFIVHEGRGLLNDLTVKENLLVGADRAERRNINSVLDLFPALRDRTSQKASLLSGGQQQMVALGRALLREPKYLLLDEPALGLAPSVIDEIYKYVSQLCHQGMGVLLVEQSVARAASVANKIALLRVGHVERVIDPHHKQDIDSFVEEAFGLHSTPGSPSGS